MKIIFTVMIVFFTNLISYSQNEDKFISCDIYIYSWSTYTRLPITAENIKENYQVKIDNKNLKSICFCRTYSSLRERLLKGEVLVYEPDGNINALVELTFAGENTINKKIAIAFDKYGNYYFENNWHVIDKLIYFYLFEFLNNTLINESVLECIKNEIEKKNICWQLKSDKE